MTSPVDRQDLEAKIKAVYRNVANSPTTDFHFEMGRDLAVRLGYSSHDLDRVPPDALESFAGVGYHLDLGEIEEGARVLDLGSGSGTDVFVAALHAGPTGMVIGIDMTDEQLAKAERLRADADVDNVAFEHGYIDDLPFEDESFDVVISNGVINLSADKTEVFAEVARVLAPGGRLAVSDILSEQPMPDSIKTNADLWAACIGGAMQVDAYREVIEAVGLQVTTMRDNPEYEFLSDQATSACAKYGVKSVSIRAEKLPTT